MTAILKLFTELEGTWTLFRNIPSQGTIRGSAIFRRDQKRPHTLLYREEGVFTSLDNKTINIFKTYIYEYKNESITVYFDETPARHFHTLSFSEMPDACYPCKALVSHKCHPDTYDGHFSFISPHEFSLYYNVHGPRKNYSIQTTFIKETQ